MNTRLRFKVIFLLVTLSLVGLLVFQGYWLRGLYGTLRQQMELQVEEAKRIADYKELFLRAKAIKQERGEAQNDNNFDISLQFSYEDDFELSTLDSTLTEYLDAIGSLENKIQRSMHVSIDSLKPVDRGTYNSILSLELMSHGIQSPDLPTSEVLTQMSGILVSSLLLLLLITVAFIYLLRTLWKQKTLEELKTDFTNNMTHELKTPISVSYSAIDALLNFGETMSEKQQKYLTIVKEQLEHLSGLVEQTLTLAVENRATFRLRLEPVLLETIFQSLVEQHRLKADKPVEFEVTLPEGIEVEADRTHLYNMLSNLIDNAIKYCDKPTCSIHLEAHKEENETMITVTDNGKGIAEANQQQVFDRFYRVPNGNQHDVKGYGLGLYYVKEMMGKHGGSVSVKSALGKGSSFILRFPSN